MSRLMEWAVAVWALTLLFGVATFYSNGVDQVAPGGLASVGAAVASPEPVASPAVDPANARALADAEAAAQATLDVFLARHARDADAWDRVKLRVAVTYLDQTEPVWVQQFQSLGAGKFRAVLADDPQSLPALAAGDVVYFDRRDIVDWAFSKGERGYGFFTVRAMMPTMPAGQAEIVAQALAPEPVPANW